MRAAGLHGSVNTTGDDVKKLDILSNEIWINQLKVRGCSRRPRCTLSSTHPPPPLRCTHAHARDCNLCRAAHGPRGYPRV
ncbi:hypothetical protein EON66_00490 [archaeon]|nr:MAG: hypothetical protein EON66_00490 [archaeon]